jgi:hypothetical protein
MRNSEILKMEKKAEKFQNATTRQLSLNVLAKLRNWRATI